MGKRQEKENIISRTTNSCSSDLAYLSEAIGLHLKVNFTILVACKLQQCEKTCFSSVLVWKLTSLLKRMEKKQSTKRVPIVVLLFIFPEQDG